MRIILVLSLLASIGTTAISEESKGTKRALIVCGLAGNEEHLEQFTESVSQIRQALVDRFGFSEDNVRVQFGRAEDAPEPDVFPTQGRGTRDEIAAEAKQLVERTKPTDSAWVFVIGHSYYDGKRVHFNIPDRDITNTQFSKLFEKLNGQQEVFFICTPVSGYYTRYLRKPKRIVMTSTEADVETNASIFHSALAQTLTEIEDTEAFDQDKNGNVSLFDLYVRSTQNLSDLYLGNDPPLIATEHPQLEDDGDGRGSEVQVDYLTMEQGGRSDAKRKRNFRKFKDGPVSAAIALPFHKVKTTDEKDER